MSKAAVLAKRQHELNDKQRQLAALMADETASIEAIVALQTQVTTLERMIPALRLEVSDEQRRDEGRQTFVNGATPDRGMLQQWLTALQAERRQLNADAVIAEAERTIARTRARDEHLAQQIAAIEAQT